MVILDLPLMTVAGNLIIDQNFTGDNVTDNHCQTESKVVINYTVQSLYLIVVMLNTNRANKTRHSA